jgi:hypothetical protein
MRASFVDVASGKVTEISLSNWAQSSDELEEIDQFIFYDDVNEVNKWLID